MEQLPIKQLQQELGVPIHWFDGKEYNLPGKGWLLVEVTPLPPSNQIEEVTADISKGSIVSIQGGKIYHSSNCTQTEHRVKGVVKKALSSLSEQSFKLAIYPGQRSVLNGQPIIIGIEPEINYMTYPDHPHLNCYDGQDVKLGSNLFSLPDSFCYTDKPNELGVSIYERLENAIDQATIWLFSHQIWVETKKYQRSGEWISPEATRFPDYIFPRFINPEGLCRCGKKVRYKHCHYKSDLNAMVRRHTVLRMTDVDLTEKSIRYSLKNWNARIEKPQKQAMNELKSVMI